MVSDGKTIGCEELAIDQLKAKREVLMSFRNLEKALKLAPKCKFYTTAGGVSDECIHRSKDMLGLKFSKQCRHFYKKCGYLSFFGSEVFGIDPDDVGTLEGNSVAYALHDREENNLPKNWLPIYDFDDGELAYLDFGNLNEENEPPVIACCYDGTGYEEPEEIAEDLGAFLLDLVEEALE